MVDREGMSVGRGGGSGQKKGTIKSVMNSTRSGAFEIIPKNPKIYDCLEETPETTLEGLQEELDSFKEASMSVQQELDDKVEGLSYDIGSLTTKEEPEMEVPSPKKQKTVTPTKKKNTKAVEQSIIQKPKTELKRFTEKNINEE